MVPCLDLSIDPGLWQGFLVVIPLMHILFRPGRWSFYELIFGVGLAIFLDVNRLQVWVWFYILMLGLLTRPGGGLATARWVLAGVYFWSGFYKCNIYYVGDNFDWFCEAFSWTAGLSHHAALAWATALLEMGMGLALLWKKTRLPAQLGLLAMHGWIILVLSPAGHNWNPVVIPWNLAMMLLLFVLFDPKWPVQPARKCGFEKAALALAVVFPALQMIGWWPYALSWKMYSGTEMEGCFYFTELPVAPRNGDLKPYVFGQNSDQISFNDWAMAELGTPEFQEKWVFKRIAKAVCESNTEKQGPKGLQILEVPIFGKEPETVLRTDCSNL